MMRTWVDQRGRQRSWAVGQGWWTALLVGVVAYLITALAIDLALTGVRRELRIAVLSQKLEHLREHADEYDTIFLGSSRVHYGLDPILFDREMARLGCPSRSFNLGLQALTIAEEHYLLEKLSQLKPAGWSRLLLERNPPPTGSFALIGTERAGLGLAGGAGLRLSLADVWTSPLNSMEKAYESAGLVLAFAYEQVGPGRLARLIRRPSEQAMPTDGRLVDLSRAGFVPVESETDPETRIRVARVDRDALAAQLAAARATASTARLSDARAALFREQVEEAGRLGREVLLVVWPHSRARWVEDARGLQAAQRDGRLGRARLVNLGDPREHPELFAPELWNDNLHLHTPGAAMITRKIAADTCIPPRRGAAGTTTAPAGAP